MNIPTASILDYRMILAECDCLTTDDLIVRLEETLPYDFLDAYVAMTLRQTDVVRVRHNTFEYIYDHFPEMVPNAAPPCDATIEPRLIAVLGRSAPQEAKRDDYRLKGWVGPTEKSFGRLWDKGHFMAHSLGGAVDKTEINVFVQSRSLNRGWSAAGKRFRQMETYCASNPGTFCFSRPIYADQTAKPAFVEFGLLKADKDLWVECFDNTGLSD